MTEQDVLDSAYAMPLTSPAYPRPPFRFVDREFVIVTYRTDPEALARVVPAPLKVAEPIVKYEFIRMPDSTGLGSYVESGQVIPVTLDGKPGAYTHAMYLDNLAGIAAGRELLGFPKVLAQPKLEIHSDSLVGTLDYNGVRVATATMTYKYNTVDLNRVAQSMEEPGYLLKIIPHVDGTTRICELVRFHVQDVKLKGAWTGPASIELHPHCLAPVSRLPVLEVVSAMHILADLTLGGGEVVHDYLEPRGGRGAR
jgi:acetoacetate decarboxylase